jgi:tetratricopeptide (TPR) repeat protein
MLLLMAGSSPHQLLQDAIRLHREGRLREAQAVYGIILVSCPDEPDALHGLGLLTFQSDRPNEGIDLIRRAISINPFNPEYYRNLAVAMASRNEFGGIIAALSTAPPGVLSDPDVNQLLGDAHCSQKEFSQAHEYFRRAIECGDASPELRNKLGSSLIALGKTEEAIALFETTVRIYPNSAEALTNLGNAILERNAPEAIRYCGKAVALQPESFYAQLSLGNALAAAAEWDSAIDAYEKAVAIAPDGAEALSGLGNAFLSKGRFAQAIDVLRRSIAIDAESYSAYLRLGNALSATGNRNEAATAFRRCLEIRPNAFEASLNLVVTLHKLEQYKDAITLAREFLHFDPDSAAMHWQLACLLLSTGDLENGWREYEWRWKWENFGTATRDFPSPRWNGENFAGRTLLVHAEQGFGDAIQFVRFLPHIASRGGKIVLECERELLGLFWGLPGTEQVIARGDPLPPFDTHCPLLSVPAALGITLRTIPSVVPYLRAPSERLEKWSRRLVGLENRLRVALAWAGNRRLIDDSERSIDLEKLGALARASNVTFFSVQKGNTSDAVKNFPARMHLQDLGPELSDFADTAAVLSMMDLVISVDTSIGHLAGALARPVWIVLPIPAEWRWLRDREDSPWYPTMRLFRQSNAGDWTDVIQRVASELARLSK